MLLHANLLKRQCHEIVDPCFFSSIDYTLASDKHTKIFSNSVSNSPRYSILKFGPALCHIALDQHFSLGSAVFKILFDRYYVRKITYERFCNRLFL
jgi:hypothetical protein